MIKKSRNKLMWVSYLVYLLALLLLLFLACEIITRNNQKISEKKVRFGALRSMVAYDPILGWKNVPNAVVRSITETYDVVYRINSEGFRDKERELEKKKGTFRILCPGDSITFGWGVDEGVRFTDLLEEMFVGVEVLNRGVQAYGIDQALLVAQTEIEKYSPDLILWYVPVDDLRRACFSKVWDRPKPLFELREGKLKLTNTPVPRVDYFSINNPSFAQIVYFLTEKSYFFYYIRDRFYTRNEAKLQPKGDESHKLALTKAIFKEMKKTADKYHAKLVTFGNFPREIFKFLKNRDILCALSPLYFNDYDGDPRDLLIDELSHPSPLGHKYMAQGMQRLLTEHKLIPLTNEKNVSLTPSDK